MAESTFTKDSKTLAKLNLSLRRYRKCRNRYKRCYTLWRDNRRTNISTIRLLITGLEQTKHKSNIASLSSNIGGVVGGVLTGLGLVTMPFSFGATTPLFISGAAVMVGAGATGLGGAAADIFISRAKCKAAQEVINRDVALTTKLQLLEQEHARALELMSSVLSTLETSHPEDYSKLRHHITSVGSSASGAVAAGSNVYKTAKLAKTLYLAKVGDLTLTSTQLMEQINPIPFINVGARVDDVLEAGSQAGVVASRGARIGLVAAAALCVVGLAIDVTGVVYNSRQIHIYRNRLKDDTTEDEDCQPLNEKTKNRDIQDDQNQKSGFLDKMTQKVTDPFKRKYISENAEVLKRYVLRLEKELTTMEENESVKDLVVQCKCKECTPIGGGSTVYCCCEGTFDWRSVLGTEYPLETDNIHFDCLTQHPAFAINYLDIKNLKNIIPQFNEPSNREETQLYLREIRTQIYTLFRKNHRTCNQRTRIPDCVHRAVVHTFQNLVPDIWMDSNGLLLNTLFNQYNNSSTVFYTSVDSSVTIT